jgi:hypothetical protein
MAGRGEVDHGHLEVGLLDLWETDLEVDVGMVPARRFAFRCWRLLIGDLQSIPGSQGRRVSAAHRAALAVIVCR